MAHRALYGYCKKGNYDEVKARLQQINDYSKNLVLRELFNDMFSQNTLLHIAVINGHSRIVRLLLENGASVNITTGGGKYTPLHVAATNGQTECAEILLEREGININQKDDFGITPYQRAVTLKGRKYREITRLIKSAEVTEAVKKNDSEQLDKTLELDASKNDFTEECFSRALLTAASNDQTKTKLFFRILSFVAHNSCFSNLGLTDCIQLVFRQDHFNIEVAALLILCWLASAENENWQLGYFLELCADDWLPSQSRDETLDWLAERLHSQRFRSIREFIKKKKCSDFAPAINIALACNHTKAAQMLLGHGSMYEKMFEVRWKELGIPSLSSKLIKGIRHRGISGYSVWDNITLLDLRRNHMETLPSSIFYLPVLGSILLNNNKLKELPKVKWISESLNHLYLSHNLLKDMPDSVASSNLRTLYLDNNRFTSIPECVCRIAGLETLDVSGNQMEWIPLEIGLLSKLTSFQFDTNKIVSPQLHVLSEYKVDATKELVTELRSLLITMKPYATIKLLVVGWQDKGKTTLVHRLRGDLTYFDRKVTQGVEVSEVCMQHKYIGIVPAGPRITFKVWDFAGQEDFYLIHMCFLSSVALYILVWDLQDEESGIKKLKTWLDNIACKAVHRTTVIIVGTHLDCISKEKVQSHCECMRDLIGRMIEERPKDKIHVADIVEISCHPKLGQGLYDLREKILKVAREIVKDKNVRVLDQPVPLSFHTLVNKIEKKSSTMQRQKELPILTNDQLWSFIRETLRTIDKSFQKEQFREAVEFLKDRGVILHFEDPNQDLRELYFIDPRWLFDLMARTITKQNTNDGLVRKDSLFAVENDEEASFTEKSRERGILLLSRFHVVHILDKDNLLIPSKFSETRPEKDVIKYEKRLRRVYKMKYLPHGFFSRLIARLLHYMNSMILEAFKDQEVKPMLPTAADQRPFLSPTTTEPAPATITITTTKSTTTATTITTTLPLSSFPPPSSIATTESTTTTPTIVAATTSTSTTTPSWPSLPPPPLLSPIRATTTVATTTTAEATIPPLTTTTYSWPLLPPPQSPPTATTVATNTTATTTTTATTPPPTTTPSWPSLPPPPLLPFQTLPSAVAPTISVRSSPTTVINLRDANILHWWRDGIQLNLPDAFLEVNLTEESTNLPCIEIKASSSVAGRQLLVFSVEHVEALITEWFHGLRDGKVSQFIPCVVCEEKGIENPHVFTLEDCLNASDCIECPKHKDTPVALRDMAPDISLHDIHPNLIFKYHELHYDKSIIKEGSFGKVYRAVLKKPTGPQKLVAIKEYKGNELESFRELRKEINILRRITHPNIIQMIGVASKPRCLALELAVESLGGVLFDKDSETIPRLILIAIATEIANALVVLHRHKIIHRDLKPSNVLIFSLKEEDPVHVKVSDFGTANFVGPYGMRAPVTRTHIRAPEVLEFALKEEYSVEVDIYSFAMLLYAMISRERAFGELPSNEIRPCVLQRKRPPWRSLEGAMNKFVNLTRLMCVSWSQSSQDRPTAVQCQKQLENPGFQALMSKIAFPPTNTVCFVYFLPCNEELWVLHQIDAHTYLSVFTGDFSSNTKHSFDISANEDLEVEAVCTRYDMMVIVMKERTNLTKKIFKIYSLTESSLKGTVNCDPLPAAVNSIASTNSHVFIATDLGCFTADIHDQTSSSVAAHHLTHEPVELILLSRSKLWMSSNDSVTVYSILTDSQLQPLYDRKQLSIAGIQQMQGSHFEDDVIWVLTDNVILMLNEDHMVCRFEIQTMLKSRQIPLSSQSQITCFLPQKNVLWLGLSTGAIVVIDLDTSQVVTCFQPYTEPVRYLVPSPDTQPPMVISCGRSLSDFLGTDHFSTFFPLSIDSSEVVKLNAKKTMNMNCEDTWEDVQMDGFSDVLLVWHSIPYDSWRRIQSAHDKDLQE